MKYPQLKEISERKKYLWINDDYMSFDNVVKNIGIDKEEIKEAEKRLCRFAPYILSVFEETKSQSGIIESPLLKINKMKQKYLKEMHGNLYLKCDNQLPISGSIKARGGIYEVLKHAESIALKSGMLKISDDYSVLKEDKFKELFSKYSIAVGSTGNLGLSIGIISAKLGFKVYVHMSNDAKQWKKDLLRKKGATVIEYEDDYGKAVEEGRRQASSDLNMHFIDDENSKDLFLGYATAGSRIKKQLEEQDILVDKNNPLFVYLPCGVGGGPGGVAIGLKFIYKDNVHIFFAEPIESPCMMIGMMTKLHDKISVEDIGLTNKTDADGLAVGRASGFVGKTLENLISGIYTVTDEELYKRLYQLYDSENIKLEPSALAGMVGPLEIFKSEIGKNYIEKMGLQDKIKNINHVVWATGGSMVPKEEMFKYIEVGGKNEKL